MRQQGFIWLVLHGITALPCAVGEAESPGGPEGLHRQTPGVKAAAWLWPPGASLALASDAVQQSKVGSSDANSASTEQDMSLLHPGAVLGAAFHVALHQHATLSLQEASEDPLPDVNITIPCLLGFISPCGNVTVGDKPVHIKTPLGSMEIPGASELTPCFERMNAAFSRYTLYFVGAASCAWLVWSLAIPARRASIIQKLKDMYRGDEFADGQADNALTAEEKELLQKRMMDPQSKDFVAPPNIYRLLALMHPPVLTWAEYLQTMFKAGVCSFMQFYVPYKIAKDMFAVWQPNGIKSFLWFLTHATEAVAMATAVGGLCHVFAGRCTNNIMVNTRANHYILTHMVMPDKSDMHAQDPSQIKWRSLHVSFWCVLSTLLSSFVSLSLFIIMYVKVATFTGDFSNIAAVAVSLYFVFDLDDKILDSHPTYRNRYDAKVERLTERIGTDFSWMKSFAHFFHVLAACIAPFAFLMLLLVSWKSSSGVIIGGDPFTPSR